jgi:hypothetical protein
VISAVPVRSAVTSPVEETDAISVLVELQAIERPASMPPEASLVVAVA